MLKTFHIFAEYNYKTPSRNIIKVFFPCPRNWPKIPNLNNKIHSVHKFCIWYYPILFFFKPNDSHTPVLSCCGRSFTAFGPRNHARIFWLPGDWDVMWNAHMNCKNIACKNIVIDSVTTQHILVKPTYYKNRRYIKICWSPYFAMIKW